MSIRHLALAVLLPSTLVHAAQEPRPPAVQTVAATSGAVQAAEFVLKSLRNFSAPELTGASWIGADERGPRAAALVRESLGGTPPRVHVNSIAVRLEESRRVEEPARFEVTLDLDIASEDGALVATTMLEELVEAIDALNGPLGVSIGSTRLEAGGGALHVSRLEVEVPIGAPLAAPVALERPLTEVVRRITQPAAPACAVRLQSDERRARGAGIERHLTIDLAGEDAGLTAAECGALLHGLEGGDAPLPVTELQLGKGQDDDPAADRWRFSARVLVGRGD